MISPSVTHDLLAPDLPSPTSRPPIPIDSARHRDKRANIPTEELREFVADERLAAELDHLGVRVLVRRPTSEAGDPLRPIDLLAGLVASGDARLQTAAIPLLLWRPDFASAAQAVAARLPERPRLMLQCFYTAAILLSRSLRDRLAALRGPSCEFPDLFSIELGLAGVGSPELRLVDLAARQAELSGEALNWLGTYEHMASEQLRIAELEAAWRR